MHLVFFSWKDITHPKAGGAEVLSHELMKRCVSDGHTVTLVTSAYKGGEPETVHAGYRIIRRGNMYTSWWHAFFYYQKNLRGNCDIVIEQMNTTAYLARLYTEEPSILFIHQLTKEVWDFELFWPASWFGKYLYEPLVLWLQRKNTVITVSNSTKQDLCSYGFAAEKIHIISEGVDIEPVSDVSTIEKYHAPTLLCLGAARPMKRTSDAITVFETVKKHLPDLQLHMAGDYTGEHGDAVHRQAAQSPYAEDITIHGRVSDTKKQTLMQRSHIIIVTSIREGWGLIVTEANSQGTIAGVYNVPGLRDSVQAGNSGIVANNNNPIELGNMIAATLTDPKLYRKLQHNAWEWSKNITFEQSYRDFKSVLKNL